MFKVEGVLGSFGTPKWTDYFCSQTCLEKEGWERGDADYLCNDDLTARMQCAHCGRGLIDVITGYGRYPAEAPRTKESHP